MSNSFSHNKWFVIVHAIAFTVALAVTSTYAPSSVFPLNRLQTLLHLHRAEPLP